MSDTAGGSLTALSETALDSLAEALLPRLAARGVVIQEPEASSAFPYAADYDQATCRQFLNPDHLGDSVLERARTFFGHLESHGEISSPDLVQLLGLKGPTSIPANLTNPLKKRARKLRIPVPWGETATPDDVSTIWVDRDGIAARMVIEIEDEQHRRGLA
jgi:hypothetical protein